MKALLDTNIIIHRETANPINTSIGELFKWLDNLHITKCINKVTVNEIEKYEDKRIVESFKIKMSSYNLLMTDAPISDLIKSIIEKHDKNDNDYNDSLLLNELLNNRVDIIITEDKDIHRKASLLNIADKIFTIDAFLEKVTIENPDLIDYKVLSVKKERFGEVRLSDTFFNSFKEDYSEFELWFNKKSEESSYTCKKDNNLLAFLYLKKEDENENYSNITPIFKPKKRLKIGTFKVDFNGYKIGERFIKIIFDNALKARVKEVYVTIFNKRPEQERLINLLKDFGFKYWGIKSTLNGNEQVYVRCFEPTVSRDKPKITFPYISANSNKFLVSIYPEYHTNLLPDSILNTESPSDFEELQPYRNAIGKVFISRSFEKQLKSGDIIIFYRTGGLYKGVITTIGIVEKIVDNISSLDNFINICGERSVFTKKDLSDEWNYKENHRPFVVFFLYTYSFPCRVNMQRLIELNVIKYIESAPRGFTKITDEQFRIIVKETKTDESIIVNQA